MQDGVDCQAEEFSFDSVGNGEGFNAPLQGKYGLDFKIKLYQWYGR